MEIWFNPSCSKCRTADQELRAAGLSVPHRRYLEDVPTEQELGEVLDRLGMQPWELARLGEQVAKDLGMSSWPRDGQHDRQRWIAAMVENPKLIQRPIVVLDDGSAVVARTPEAVQQVIGAAGADQS